MQQEMQHHCDLPPFNLLKVSPTFSNKKRQYNALTLVSFSGNICSGKTSLLHAIEARDPRDGEMHMVFTESVEKWQDELKCFYDNPDDASCLFRLQLVIIQHYYDITNRMVSILNSHKQGDPTLYFYVERSPMEALEVFVLQNSSIMTVDQRNRVRRLYSFLTNHYLWATLCSIVYCQVDLSQQLLRLTQRERNKCYIISPAYLRGLSHRYIQFIKKYKKQGKLLCILSKDAKIKERMATVSIYVTCKV